MNKLKGLVAAVVLSVLSGAPAWAQGQVPSLFVVDPKTPVGPEIRTADADVAMIVQLRATGVVSLDQALTHTGLNWFGAKPRQPLSAGEILTTTGAPGVYCTPQRMTLMSPRSPCLWDRDGDGRFDESLSSFWVAFGPRGTHLTDKQQLVPVFFSESAPLPSAVRYSPVGLESSPVLKAKLRWRKATYPKAPGQPTVVTLWLDGSASVSLGSGSEAKRGIGSYSPEQSIHLGQPNDRVQIGGLTIQVLGLDKTGHLQYRLEAYTPDVVVPFFYRQPTTYTIYL